MYRTRICCAHFQGRVEARAEQLTHRGWESDFSVVAGTAQEALRGLVQARPDWHGVEVRHMSSAVSA
jgi:hypothetical protein